MAFFFGPLDRYGQINFCISPKKSEKKQNLITFLYFSNSSTEIEKSTAHKYFHANFSGIPFGTPDKISNPMWVLASALKELTQEERLLLNANANKTSSFQVSSFQASSLQVLLASRINIGFKGACFEGAHHKGAHLDGGCFVGVDIGFEGAHFEGAHFKADADANKTRSFWVRSYVVSVFEANANAQKLLLSYASLLLE